SWIASHAAAQAHRSPPCRIWMRRIGRMRGPMCECDRARLSGRGVAIQHLVGSVLSFYPAEDASSALQ
ncbi:MAG: hypothetical protein AAFO72_09955, partial [Pseudomonadota bacterium]